MLGDCGYMNIGIELCKATAGQTSPNPVVGAVVVKEGRIVGLGAHLKAGEAHAEVHALQMAGESAQGATLYCTLEPCSHTNKKTPPCVDRVIDSGVSRVVIANIDPNPQVSGRGVQKLVDAGLQVEVGLLAEEAAELNRIFFHFIRTGRPFVTLKSATTLDGKIATSSGESRWITGEAARTDAHTYRHRCDAILVGVGTVLADDPLLTTRPEGRNPIRIILDRQLRTPLEAKVVQNKEAATWIITTEQVSPARRALYEQAGVRVLCCGADAIEIMPLLDLLGELGVTSLLVEGGGQVNRSFLQSGLVNEWVTYLSPMLIGGQSAYSAYSDPGFERIADAVRLQIRSVQQMGEDLKIVCLPQATAEGQ